MPDTARPTGHERIFREDEIIVSKTDRSGRITYANDVFLRVAGFREDDVLGKPHSLVRHPDMPRCVFALLWERILSGQEVFAYVVNLAQNGDHYWVFAHVTPTFDSGGQVVGFHSNRRAPRRSAVETVRKLYGSLAAVEREHAGKADAIRAGTAKLREALAAMHTSYDELMFSLEGGADGRSQDS